MGACCPSCWNWWWRSGRKALQKLPAPKNFPEVTIANNTPPIHTEEDERYRALGENAEMLSQMCGVDIYSVIGAISQDATFNASSSVDEQANTEEASNELQRIGNRIVRANNNRIGHVVLRSGQSIDVFEVYTEKQPVGWPTSLLTRRRVYFCGKPARDGSRGRVVGSVIVRFGNFKPCRLLRSNVVSATWGKKRAWCEGVQEALLLCV